MKAIWKGVLLAQSDNTMVVEGNHYFPRESLAMEYFRESDNSTHCPWKGDASYYTLNVEGEENVDAAWYYAEPKEAAQQILNRVAFWHGVEVIDS